MPVADAAVAIVRRLRARTALLRGDRGHVYDQLVDRGWSARRASAGTCAAAQALLTVVGIAVSVRTGTVAVAVTAAVVIAAGAAAFAAFTSPRAWTPER